MTSFFNLNLEKIENSRSKIDDLTRYRALGVFCVYAIFALSLFEYILILTRSLKSFEIFRITLFVVTLLFSFFFYRMIKRTGFPWKMFGITWINAKRSIIESVILSLIVCGLILFFKWVLITYDNSFSGVGLFSTFHGRRVHHYAHAVFVFFAFLYILFVPLQSFLLHSVFQSSLMNFLPKRQNIIIPIIIVSFAFGSIHAEFNLIFSLLVMLITLFWATLYARHRTIVGVTLSHMIIGSFALPVMQIIGITARLSKQFFN